MRPAGGNLTSLTVIRSSWGRKLEGWKFLDRVVRDEEEVRIIVLDKVVKDVEEVIIIVL